MARYLKIAAEANRTAKALYELVTQPADPITYKAEVACQIAHLVNYGLRCCPRPPQHQVRLNAVREAVRGLPVRVTMEDREDDGRMYHVLVVDPVLD